MASFVFDFDSQPVQDTKKAADTAYDCTFKTIETNREYADADHPVLVLFNPQDSMQHHVSGTFVNPHKRFGFLYEMGGREYTANVLEIDKRFIELMNWLKMKHMTVRLSGAPKPEGFAVYKIRVVDSGGKTVLKTEDSFLQFAMGRLFASQAPEDEPGDDDVKPEDLRLTSMPEMTNFVDCAGASLPADIRSWAHRNIELTHSSVISTEERRHAQRALSIMLNIQWKGDYFESIDPVEARRILDEELYGMEKVKQRIIETIIQINRTHTLPAYGLLLVGPAGIGKSQVAYAVARILKLPWTSLDMSTIRDPEALTGTPRVYSNAKPGRIMEAFAQAGTSHLVFIINELDKADSGNFSSNPADALLTLLDNLGFTDNYMECMIPTGGVYPIATANDKSRISLPLMSRFAVIDIPDYTIVEKKIIFQRFSLPKVLKRMGMKSEECIVEDDAVDVIIDKYKDQSGCRDLEQAAEHLAANALYRIETQHTDRVVFDAAMTEKVLEM